MNTGDRSDRAVVDSVMGGVSSAQVGCDASTSKLRCLRRFPTALCVDHGLEGKSVCFGAP